MFFYEIKKLGKKRVFWIFTVTLLLGNLLTIYVYNKNTDSFYYVYEHKDKYESFLNDGTDWEGYYQSDWEKQEEYIEQYPVFLEKMEERVSDMQTLSVFSGENSFVYRNLEKTCRDFRTLAGISVNADNCFGIRQLADYNTGLLYTVCFLVMLTWFVFYHERNRGMFLLIKGTKKGHFPLACGKFGVMMLFAAGYTCLQECSTILFLGYLYGYGNWNRSIQSVSLFRNCPYLLTVGNALLLLIIIRVLTAEVLALIFYLFGIGIRNELTAAVITTAIYGVEFSAYKIISINGSLNGLKCINPFFCWNMKQELGEYRNLNILGYAVGKDVLTLIVGCILMAGCIAGGIVWFHNSCQLRSRDRMEKLQIWMQQKTGYLWKHTGLFRFECFKVLIWQKKGLVLVLLLLLCIGNTAEIQKNPYYDTPGAAMYHSYMKQLCGKVTEQSIEFVREEQKNIDDLYQRLSEYGGNESGRDSLIQKEIQLEIETKEEGVKMLCEQLEGLQGKEGSIYDKYWVDERAYMELWYHVKMDLVQFLIGCIGIFMLIGGVYPADEKKNMLPLLRSTRNGRRFLNRSKNLCCLLGTLAVFGLAEYPLFLRYQKVDEFASVSQKMCDLTQIPLETELTLGGFLVLIFLLKSVLFLVVAAGTMIMSRVTGNEIITIAIGSGIITAVVILCYYFRLDGAVLLLRMMS